MAATTLAEPGRGLHPFAALIESSPYRRYYLGQGVSLIGTWLQAAAVSWLVYDLTRSEWWLGVIEAVNLLPGLLVGLYAGALADRVAPRSMILAMQVVQMTLALVLGGLVGLGVVQVWQMALVLALARVSVTFEMPSRQVFLYELVGRRQLLNAIALNSGLFNASRVVGPMLAGLCLARLGPVAPFLLNGVSYLAAIVAVLTIREGRSAPPRADGEGDRAGLLAGLAHLNRDRRLAALFLMIALFGVVGMGYSAMLPAYARVVVGTGALGYSVLTGSGGLGATFGALVVASAGGLRRFEPLVLIGLGVFAAALGGAAVLPGVPGPSWWPLAGASASLMVAGFGAIMVFSATQTLIQSAVPDGLRGRIMGLWMIVYSATVPLGALITGRLAQSWGVPAVMGLSAAACAATALIALAAGWPGEGQIPPPARPLMTEA